MTESPTSTSSGQLTAENANARFMQGIAYHRGGLTARAQGVYDEILAVFPMHFGALHFSGVLALQNGQAQRAVDLISAAVGVFNGDGSAYSNLGNAQRALGQLPQALTSYSKAISLLPDHLSSVYNRGCVLFTMGRIDEALADFQRAGVLQPLNADVLSNTGNCFTALGRVQDALASYTQALAVNPHHVEALYNRAVLRVSTGSLAEGLADYDSALAQQPGHYDSLVNRGNVLLALQRAPEAIASLRQAVAVDAKRLEGWYNLANALADSGEVAEQLRAFQTAEAISPGVDFVRGSILNLQMRLCEWKNFAAEFAVIRDRLASGAQPIQPFPLLALTDSAALQLQAARGFCSTLTGAIAPRAVQVTPRRAGPIRIGYFSTHMSSHAVASQMAQLYESHDKTRFEVFGYALSASTNDAVQQRLVRAFDHYADLSTLSDPQAVQRVAADQLDIAVDLNGYTSSFRSGLFALGCAPVQVAYLGYAGTTGAPYIDYLIADRLVIPEHSRQHYSEQIVYLPDSFMVNDNTRVRSERQFTRAELGLPEQGFVFRCYNNSYKILPEVFDCWMRLLQQVPGSVLWLLDENPTATANLKREAQQRGIDPGRLVFSGRIEMSEHFARNRVADLFLDTFPYTAHSTACDALWSGLPVLTRMGDSFASRVAGSLLTAMNLPELITHSLAEYEARALHLAQHPQELFALRERLIANRDSGPLFNTETFARRIEAAYTLMHQRRVDGLPPAHLDTTLFSPIPIEHS